MGVGSSIFIGLDRRLVNYLFWSRSARARSTWMLALLRRRAGGLAPLLPTTLLTGFKVAPASPRPSPAAGLPAIDEMNHDAEKRQADDPIPKEPRSGNQGSAGHENDPFDHTKEGWLSLLRERHPQLSSDCIVHSLIVTAVLPVRESCAW